MNFIRPKVSYEEFLPHVIVNTIGKEDEGQLPDDAAISFIRNSAIEFARKSGVLCETMKIDLQCGLGEYLIETDSTIIGIKRASMGEWEHLDFENSFMWSWGSVQFQLEKDVLKVWPVPSEDCDRGLELEIVVAPSRKSCEVDELLYNRYFDAVVDGALSEIHMMPNRPWSSVSRADYKRRRFEDSISSATVDRVLKGNRRPMKALPNPDWIPCSSRGFRRRW